MPETDVIPTSASVASTGKGIRYIGDYAYAYSGSISVEGAPGNTTILEFITGAGLIHGSYEVHGNFDGIGQSQIILQVELNEEIVILSIWSQALDATILDFPTPLILPPFTKVKISMQQSSGTDRDMQITFTGRVYGEA